VINIGPALHLGFSLILLWGLLFFCWKELRLDSLRDKLFGLRHELFMLAASKRIPFDDPTYKILRDLINGMIRFAHKLSFSRLFLAMVDQRLRPDPQLAHPMKQWQEAVSKLPDEPRIALTAIHDDMFRAVMKHMASGNPVVLLAFALLLTIRSMVQLLSRGATQNLSVLKAGRDLHLNLIEAQALEAQELEIAYGECGLARV
jgi:hypothetical protein